MRDKRRQNPIYSIFYHLFSRNHWLISIIEEFHDCTYWCILFLKYFTEYNGIWGLDYHYRFIVKYPIYNFTLSTSSTITLSWVSENHLCHVLLERAHKISSTKFVYVLCLFSIDKIKVVIISTFSSKNTYREKKLIMSYSQYNVRVPIKYYDNKKKYQWITCGLK